ncbi:N-acetylmuramoyl-L-alanine amidase [Prevotella sp. P3-120]|uniref:Peptidoglycan hydrolase n=1 Tax=Xylanibacter brevis TaxID=83231 RepID=A0ABS9CEW6_9BACT|nr:MULTISPECIES: glucosaminidase domain-containing protein [Prevotellaceae]MBS7318563.1 glucosaminidase domain-containing protein [Prevotella sp.]MCF2558738.1 glucosaminidase domain-containing protein [Xylanibacter brevis]MCF2563632.1 glucosaminidase domain-containing protein [Xylanibacter brevis]MCI7002165.1 glucosaminidase domain-containing protein [Prevotella sp.]MDD7172154.1 glucosaminidase domain-containing protein [Prevotella sp.]
MRRISIGVALLLLLPFTSVAQIKWNTRYQEYFDRYKDLAIEQMKKHRIPASITLAQGVLESGAGYSELARKGNNHFGIKCHGWTGRTTYHDDDERNECFRAYDNVYDSYEDHSVFLVSSRRYSSLFRLNLKDYKGWAHGLKSCGYATNPRYAAQLIDIIQLYKLYQYDEARKYNRYNEYQTHQPTSLMHTIHSFNKNYYVVAKKGDTFALIGKEVGVSARKLASFNELYVGAELEEGTYVWLQKKRRNAPKEYKNRAHYVRPGESMYSISQKYGIRLKYLYKLNHLPADYQLEVGDRLYLR